MSFVDEPFAFLFFFVLCFFFFFFTDVVRVRAFLRSAGGFAAPSCCVQPPRDLLRALPVRDAERKISQLWIEVM